MYIIFRLNITWKDFQIKKILKYFLIIIGVIAVIAIVLIVLIGTLSSNERKIANDFTLLSSSGEYNEASNLMHDALKKEFTNSRSFKKHLCNCKWYCFWKKIR